MSAVLPFLELKPDERGKKDVIDEVVVHEEDLLMGLGEDVDPKPKRQKKPKEPVDPLAKPHTELTRLLWARERVAMALKGAKFKLEVDNGTLMVAVIPAVARDVVPWSFSGDKLRRFSLFSTNSKMACPTWDLPAGDLSLGGSCPGAVFAQSTVPRGQLQTVEDRSSPEYGNIIMNDSRTRERLAYLVKEVKRDRTHLPADEQEGAALNLNTTVCTRCYATGGKYGEAIVQFSEVARLALINAMLKKAETRERLISLIVDALELTKMSWNRNDVERHGIRPVRVHSSGDFYKRDYALMWLEVARRLHQNALAAKARGDDGYKPVVLWAPTRTHVLESWNVFWVQQRDLWVSSKGADGLPPNFVIRPSAYSVGDPAPYIKRESPTGSKGTSVLFGDDSASRLKKRATRPQDAFVGDGTKFNWQCGVYALDDGEKTCLLSTAPDGQRGCRACWKFPHMAVNYVIH